MCIRDRPCVLCVYQRYPYAIIIILGIVGFIASYKNTTLGAVALSAISLSFFVNSIIAFYHSGVERKWWSSFLEGCSVPTLQGNIDQILTDIQSRAKAVRCDEIPWADPLFGLSMANYNVIVCLALASICLISAVKILRLN